MRDSSNGIYLDSGTLLSTLTGTVGFGACLLPFRPGASPQSWMYVATSADYKKFSAPTISSDSVTVHKVGIAEPQTQIEAAPQAVLFTSFAGTSSDWTNAGQAGAISDFNLINDTVLSVYPDPVIPTTRFSVRVDSTLPYITGLLLTIGAFTTVVQDVIPALTSSSTLTVQAIRYDSGSTGRCTIVTNQIPVDPDGALRTLRRGSLIGLGVLSLPAGASASASLSPSASQSPSQSASYSISPSPTPPLTLSASPSPSSEPSEIVYVLNSVTGPDNTLSFECVTVGTILVGDAITGIPAIVVDGIDATVAGQAITCVTMSSTINAVSASISPSASVGAAVEPTWIGAFSRSFATDANPFTLFLGSSTKLPQDADYINIVLTGTGITTDIALFRFIFNVGDIIDFYSSVYEYSVEGTALANSNLGNRTLVRFPISALQRKTSESGVLVSDNKTLADCNGFRIEVTVTEDVLLLFGPMWVGGGGQPDVGTSNPGYRYLVRPRSSVSGARGNPCPIMRYEVRPQRQPVLLQLPSPSYDAQIDTWDIYRYGGAVTSYRYIASIASTQTTFTDVYPDAHALGGAVIELDNYEPWPSIDEPFIVEAAP